MFQHVVNMQNVRRGNFHAFEIAAGEFQVAVFTMRNEQSRFVAVQLAERFTQTLGLVRFEIQRIDHGQPLLRQFRGQRGAQRAQKHFLWQRVAVIARLRSVNRSAMAPQRRSNRANARAARALLPPQLAASAAHFALVLGFVGARANLALIPARRLVQQMRIHLRAKNRVGELHFAHFLATQIDYVHDRHNFASFSKLDKVLLRFLLFARLADKNVRPAWPRHGSLHEQQVFVRIHFHDFQILGRHLRVAHVTRKVLVLPDTRWKRAATDAAWRAVKHRTVRRIAASVVPALHAAGKTLTLADAAYIHKLACREIFHQHAVADFCFVRRLFNTHFLKNLHRRYAGLLEMPGHGFVHALRLDEFHEAELRGFVAVDLLRTALHHYTRARLQDCASNQRSICLEDLRHPQLDSDNPVDRHRFVSLFRSLPCFWYWLRLAQDAGLKPGATKLLCCCVTECFDFHVHAWRKIELHQRVDRVRCRLEDIDQTLVRAHLELLARFFVDVRRPQHCPAIDRGGQRNRARNIRARALCRIHNFLRGLVQNAVVVRFQTNSNFVALSHLINPQPSLIPHYSMISVTAPAPTVWPPSRIANRNPFSSATGVISVTSQLTLSPGITISTPVGNFTSPVTSVVRK